MQEQVDEFRHIVSHVTWYVARHWTRWWASRYMWPSRNCSGSKAMCCSVLEAFVTRYTSWALPE